MTIGERIKKAREIRGLSQNALALKIGGTLAHIRQFEKEKAWLISRVVIKLADALEVSADYLLGRVDEKMDRVFQAIRKLDDDRLEYIEKIAKVLADVEPDEWNFLAEKEGEGG